MKLLLLSQLMEAREDFIANQQASKILNAYKADKGRNKPKFKTPLEIVKAISVAGNQNIQWLVNQYIMGNFYLEDLPTLQQSITKFNQLKPKLPNAHRDLNRYKSVQDLRTVIAQHEQEQTQKTKQKAEDHDTKSSEYLNKSQAELFYKGDTFTVVIPKTKEASIHLGKETEWCTAHEDDDYNYFDRYHSNNTPLYIFTMNDGTKFQLWIPSQRPSDDDDEAEPYYEEEDEGVQFKDAADEDIEIETVIVNYPETKLAFDKIIKLRPEDAKNLYTDYGNMDSAGRQRYVMDNIRKRFPTLPAQYQTNELAKRYVLATGNYIAVADRLLTQKLVDQTLSMVEKSGRLNVSNLQDPRLAKLVDPKLRRKLIMKLDGHGWEAIKTADSEEEYKELLIRNANVIASIPPEKQTGDLVNTWAALPISSSRSDLFKFIRPELLTTEVIYKALSNNGKLIEGIPKDKQTKEMVNIACKSGGDIRQINTKLLDTNNIVDVLTDWWAIIGTVLEKTEYHQIIERGGGWKSFFAKLIDSSHSIHDIVHSTAERFPNLRDVMSDVTITKALEKDPKVIQSLTDPTINDLRVAAANNPYRKNIWSAFSSLGTRPDSWNTPKIKQLLTQLKQEYPDISIETNE